MLDSPATVAVPDEGAGVLLATDQIADLGGNERALASLLELCPRARALSLGFAGTNMPEAGPPAWHDRVRLVPMGGRRRVFLSPLYARRMALAPVGSPQVALCVVHAGWSLGWRLPKGTRGICYSAGLPPSLFEQVEEFLQEHPRPLRPALRRAVPRLRDSWRAALSKPHRLIANSHYTARLLEREAGRGAEVVYPPVRTDYFTPAGPPRPDAPFLLVARLVRQKRADIAIEAFRGLEQRLVVVGDGPDAARLRRLAPPNVTFAGALHDPPLRELYRASRGYVCTSSESFGIAVCEAQAAGRPAIAPAMGGPAETVHHGETGLLLDRVDPRSVGEAVRTLAERDFDPAACRASAERFSEERFKREMAGVILEELGRASTP